MRCEACRALIGTAALLCGISHAELCLQAQLHLSGELIQVANVQAQTHKMHQVLKLEQPDWQGMRS